MSPPNDTGPDVESDPATADERADDRADATFDDATELGSDATVSAGSGPTVSADAAVSADPDAEAAVETAAAGGTTLSRPATHPVDALVSHEETVANGVRLHYVEAGPADGPLAVLLHGFPDYWYAWRGQIPALVDDGFRVVAPDMRGYNRSEKPHGVGAYQLERLARDVEGLIHACGEDRAAIVGHDWGGMVAWETATARPSVVDRLAVLNAPHPVEYARNLSIEQAVRSWYALAFQLPWLPERLLRAGEFRAIERTFREGTARASSVTDGGVDGGGVRGASVDDGGVGDVSVDDTDLERYRTALSRPGALASALNYYRAFFRHTFRANLRANVPFVGAALVDAPDPVEAPTLVCWGERDPALSVARTTGLDRYARDLRIERFADAGHWVHVDEREAVDEALTGFLSDR